MADNPKPECKTESESRMALDRLSLDFDSKDHTICSANVNNKIIVFFMILLYSNISHVYNRSSVLVVKYQRNRYQTKIK